MDSARAQRVSVAGYARRSTEDQAGSLTAQWAALEAHAERHGFTLVERFEDDGVTGTTTKRPGLQALLERAAEPHRPWSTVLVWDLKRFSRPEDPREAVVLCYRLESEHGVRVVPLHGVADVEDPLIDTVAKLIEFGQAGKESIDKSRDVLRGMRHAVLKGMKYGRIPYGYDALYVGSDGTPRRRVRTLADGTREIRSPDGTQLLETWSRQRGYRRAADETPTIVPGDPQRVTVVRRVFAEYVSGLSARRIAYGLNADGLPSPRGVQWRRNTILRLLGNPAYAGTMAWNRHAFGRFHRVTPDGTVERVHNPDKRLRLNPPEAWVVRSDAWPPLVDPGQWADAQTRLESTRKPEAALQGRGQASTYLVSGLLRCGRCGDPMVGSGDAYEKRYRCTGRRDKGPSHCDGGTVVSELVDAYVADRVTDLFLAPDARQRLLNEVAAVLDAEPPDTASDRRKALLAQLAEAEQRIQRLVDRVAAGVLEDDEAASALTRLREQKIAAQEALAELGPASVNPQAQRKALLREVRERLDHYAAVWRDAEPAIRKRIVRAFCVSLSVDTSARVLRYSLALGDTGGIADDAFAVHTSEWCYADALRERRRFSVTLRDPDGKFRSAKAANSR
ncbi:MAG: recombinase family protein [Planctomycetota bacterium]